MKVNNLRIEDVCDFVGGSQPPKSEFINIPRDGYIRLIQTRDYKTEAFPTYIQANSTKKFCDAKDIMIGRYGPPIFQICRGLTGAYNVALLKAKPKKLIDQEYLYYFLQQDAVFQYVDKLSARTGGQTGVDLVSLNKYPIRLPEDIQDQKKLVSVLTALDAKIDCNNRINTELEAMAKTLYDYWFVQFDFPDANGKPYQSSGGKMVYNATLKRDIPTGWEDGTLDDLGQIVGGSTPSTTKPGNFTTNGTPWITPYDLSGNQENKFITRGAQDVSDEGVKDASLKKHPAGTVLLSSRAPIGYMAIARIELTTNQGFKSFIPTNGYSTTFIYYTVKNALKAITQYASGSTFKEVSGTVLKTVKIILPKSDIIGQFSSTVESIFRRQDLLEQENQHLIQLRDWLLPMLMNGQVQVRDNFCSDKDILLGLFSGEPDLYLQQGERGCRVSLTIEGELNDEEIERVKRAFSELVEIYLLTEKWQTLPPGFIGLITKEEIREEVQCFVKVVKKSAAMTVLVMNTIAPTMQNLALGVMGNLLTDVYKEAFTTKESSSGVVGAREVKGKIKYSTSNGVICGDLRSDQIGALVAAIKDTNAVIECQGKSFTIRTSKKP